MSTNINKAGFASALDKTTQGLASGMQNREQAQLEKLQAQQQMDQIDYADETDAWRAEIDAARAESQETTRKLQKANMFRGLKYFTEDKNPRHLNSLLKGGPMSKSGIIRFAKIDETADTALMANAGLDMEDASNEYGDSARFVKGIMQDGSEKIFDVYKVKQMTGYFQSLNDQEVARELTINEQSDVDPDDPEGLKTGGEWGKKAWVAQKTGVADPKSTISSLKRDMEQGNVGGKLQEVEVRTEALNKEFGNNFMLNFDPTDEQHRLVAYPHIAAIEKLEGVEFDSSTRKELRDISVLLGLGEPGATMSEQETGIIDSLVTDVKRYVTNDGGSEAVSAYAAFRNSLRHALYGSALTESEIKSFNEQFGTRRQQLGPLIKQMKTAMNQVKSKLSSVADMQNPYSARYRIGAGQDKADEIIVAMQQRIDLLSDLERGKATELTPEGQATKDARIIGETF